MVRGEPRGRAVQTCRCTSLRDQMIQIRVSDKTGRDEI